MNSKNAPIVWAVDPFVSNPKLQFSALTAIDRIARTGNAPIIPTYVTSSVHSTSTRKMAEERLEWVWKTGKSKFKRLVVLSRPFQTVRDGVSDLLRFAKKSKAQAIVLSTHARKGPSRWFLGSFAETLAIQSDLPVLIARPEWKFKQGANEVLFMTDFGEEAEAAYFKLLSKAKQKGWKITIYNRVVYPFYYPEYDAAAAAWAVYEKQIQDEAQANRKKGRLWVEWAKRAGVEAELKVDTRRVGDTAEAAVKLLKPTFLFVALANRKRNLVQKMMGSTARKMIRYSPVPVWVIQPSSSKEAKAERPDWLKKADRWSLQERSFLL